MALIKSCKEEDIRGCNQTVCSEEIKIEDILEDAGGYGWFQRLFTFLAFYPQIPAAMIVLSPVFTGGEKTPLICRNTTDFHRIHTCGINCSDTLELDEFGYATIVQEWDLVCSRKWMVEATTSCQMVGMMIGSIVTSLVSDSYGRTKGFFMTTLCMGIFGMLPSLAIDPWSYALSRFLAGFGAGGIYVVYLVHLMEFLTPAWRTICGTVSLFPLGEMTLGLFGYLIPHWRILTLVSAAPVLLLLIFTPFIQESPRWLLTHNKTKEAHEILEKISRWNSKPPTPVARVEALQETILKQSQMTMSTTEMLKLVTKNRVLMKQLFILSYSNICCSIMYYGVSFSARDLSGHTSINLLYMGILDFLRIPAAMGLSGLIGRKRTMIFYMTWALMSLVVILIMDFSSDLLRIYPLLLTGLTLCGRFGTLCAWSMLICMTLESFPTLLRSSCLGFVSLAGYLGSIIAPQCLLLSSVMTSLPFIGYCVLMSTCTIMSIFLRDMADKPLADTLVEAFKDNQEMPQKSSHL